MRTPDIPPGRDDIARLMSNARAAERERLRSVARRAHPGLDGADLEAKVRELEIEKLRAAGRRGRANQQQMYELGKLWLAAQPEIVGRLEDLLAFLNAITADTEAAA